MAPPSMPATSIAAAMRRQRIPASGSPEAAQSARCARAPAAPERAISVELVAMRGEHPVELALASHARRNSGSASSASRAGWPLLRPARQVGAVGGEASRARRSERQSSPPPGGQPARASAGAPARAAIRRRSR